MCNGNCGNCGGHCGGNCSCETDINEELAQELLIQNMIAAYKDIPMASQEQSIIRKAIIVHLASKAGEIVSEAQEDPQKAAILSRIIG